jgi:hypothetical protein
MGPRRVRVCGPSPVQEVVMRAGRWWGTCVVLPKVLEVVVDGLRGGWGVCVVLGAGQECYSVSLAIGMLVQRVRSC